MKKTLLYILVIAGLISACNDEQTYQEAPVGNTSKEMTTMQWIDSARDFGKITEGQILEVSFRFRNTGSKPLVIRGVHPGCGCTVANPPDKPIAPGAEGEIKGTFNSKGRPGVNHKEIDVEANTAGDQHHKITFSVEVLPEKK
ncbi:MAG: DUF1573 domain-containing protein [Candidatus Pseudobacter hemicellulosilyticus]|uniref:DUF1573 domain-containing protein n=1 Tax=Candidatus Pseudobacter hemicellulosilyticus TaxID=3121375 RepID=A0AAJ5WQL1_9BACT|nr:MAG: DUF1573 domain-containing protein [Pseudobacter sp.]